MAAARPKRRLIVNADDFGASRSINAAVIDAHRRGILTSASLMVNGAAADEAIELARENVRLGVGLHLTLCCGTSTLSPAQIPNLVNQHREFRNSPVRAGMSYFFSSAARRELALELAAQFDRFERSGLMLDHVNGHLHFHLHPAVFAALRRELDSRHVRAIRFTRDPISIDWALGKGRWFYRGSHAIIFAWLSQRQRAWLRDRDIRHTEAVFGLLENGRVTEEYIVKLLAKLKPGDSELYSHPSLDEFKHEYDALISERVRETVCHEELELIRYQDLWRE